MASRGPIFLYVLPLLSVLVLGISIFVGTDGGIVRSATVMGGPTDTDAPFRGRLQVIEEKYGAVVPVGGRRVVLRARQAAHLTERSLKTDETGWAEFEIPLKRGASLELEVREVDGHILARGDVALEARRWLGAARRRGGPLPRHEKGQLGARTSLSRGAAAVPFYGMGKIEVDASGEPLAGATIKVEVTGATLRGASDGKTDESGGFSFEVAPQQHVAVLHVSVEHELEKWKFDQTLPVIPGAYGLEQVGDGYVVLSPVPRDEVWFTFVTEGQRLAGGRVALSEDAQGIFSGKIPPALVPKTKDRFLVLASSADGRSPSTVGYPLDGQSHTLDVWDAYLLDGGPAERLRVEARRRKIRWTLGAYAALSGLLTLLLFVSNVRHADRELKERLEGAGATAETRENSPLPLLVAVIGLFFAFSAGVLWIVAR